MSIKIYGPEDENPALLTAVLSLLEGVTDASILMFQRQPPNAKPCQYPNRLRFEIVIDGRAHAAYQNADGSIELPKI
jgi:hypothetical protein